MEQVPPRPRPPLPAYGPTRPPQPPFRTATSIEDVETAPLKAVPADSPARPSADPVSPPKNGLSWLRSHAALGLISILAVYFLTINVSVPWQAAHEDNGNVFTSAAISHIRYGLEVTKGQDYVDQAAFGTFGPSGAATREQYFDYYLDGPVHPVVYGNHPPLLGLTIAGSLLVFGYHFWAVRLVPIAFSLLGLILLYALVGHLFDLTIARVAAALYATFPMFDYFGRNVAHEAPTLFFALAMLTGYIHWREDGRSRWIALMVAATVLGGFYDWPMLYFAPIVFGVDWLVRRRPSATLLLATLVPAAVTFVLVLAQIVWAHNGNLASLQDIFLFRVAGGGVEKTTTAIGWLNTVSAFNSEGFGAWSQLALPVAALFVVGRASAEGWSARVQLVVICGLWGLSHLLIFRNGALYHAYWQFYLLPFYAVVLAWAAVTLVRHFAAAPAVRAAALVFFVFAALSLNLPNIFALFGWGNHPVVPVLDIWR
jgi:4-amino-4-deoxy-L-arabinose transferase-like glycosyltransferase